MLWIELRSPINKIILLLDKLALTVFLQLSEKRGDLWFHNAGSHVHALYVVVLGAKTNRTVSSI